MNAQRRQPGFQRPDVECAGKKIYPSFAVAERACRKVVSDVNDDRHLVPYKCTVCHHWHAGNQTPAPSKRDDRVRKRWKNWHWWKEEGE